MSGRRRMAVVSAGGDGSFDDICTTAPVTVVATPRPPRRQTGGRELTEQAAAMAAPRAPRRNRCTVVCGERGRDYRSK